MSLSLRRHLIFWGYLLGFTALLLLPNPFKLIGLSRPPGPLGSTSIPWDKLAHLAGYASLFLIGTACYSGRVWSLIVLCSCHAAFGELAQSLTGYRVGDWLDLVADLIGLLSAALIVRWLDRRQQ